MNPFLEQSLTTPILKIHISSIQGFKSCNNSDSLSCILSPLNRNDDQNLMYPDNFLESADYFVPTSFSRILSVQTTTSSRLRANIYLPSHSQLTKSTINNNLLQHLRRMGKNKAEAPTLPRIRYVHVLRCIPCILTSIQSQ